MDQTNPLTSSIDPFGIWRMSIAIGLFVIVACWVDKQPRWLGWQAKLLWIYVLVSALWILEFPSFSFGPWHTAYQATAGQTFAEALLIPIAAILFSRHIWKLVPWLVWFEIVLLWLTPNHRGLMNQGSFDSALLALCVPFVPPLFKIASILTILTRHGSVAFSILGVQLLAYATKYKWARYTIVVGAPMLVFLAFHYAQGPMLDGSFRFQAYSRFMAYWAADWERIIFGVGPGSFLWTSLLIDGFKRPMWFQMHSDWLQMTFELGLIGIGLVLVVTWQAISGVWNRPKWLAAVLGACAFATFYHPLRFIWSSIVIAVIFKTALEIKTARDTTNNY